MDQLWSIATDLITQSAKKRAAVFLACVGTEAYEVFQTMDFEKEEDRADIDKVMVIEAFEAYCVGEVNVTFERYVFNNRTQNVGEAFEVFLSNLRRLSKLCVHGTVEESILRDRTVVGRGCAWRHNAQKASAETKSCSERCDRHM